MIVFPNEKSATEDLLIDLRESVAFGDLVPVAHLVSHLNHRSEAIRKLAVQLLEYHINPVVIPALLQAAADPNLEINVLAAEILSNFRQPEAVDYFLKGLDHAAPEVRLAAVIALREHHADKIFAPLVGLLADPEPEVRREAVSALAAYRNTNSLKAVRTALRDHSPAVRRIAIEVVVTFESAFVFDDLIVALSDSDWRVRRAAAANLSRFPDPATENALYDLLEDPASQVVREAALALSRLRVRGDERLVRLLGHEVPEVRIAAAGALGESGEPLWIPYLVTQEQDTDTRVRRTARQAVQKLEADLPFAIEL